MTNIVNNFFFFTAFHTSKSTTDEVALDGRGIVVMLLMNWPKSSLVFNLQSPEKAHKIQNIRYRGT